MYWLISQNFARRVPSGHRKFAVVKPIICASFWLNPSIISLVFEISLAVKTLYFGSPFFSIAKRIWSLSAVTVNRELLLVVEGFNATLPYTQGYELWLRLPPYIKLHIIKEFLGYYIEVPTSVEEFACSSDVLMQQFFVILNIPVGASAC